MSFNPQSEFISPIFLVLNQENCKFDFPVECYLPNCFTWLVNIGIIRQVWLYVIIVIVTLLIITIFKCDRFLFFLLRIFVVFKLECLEQQYSRYVIFRYLRRLEVLHRPIIGYTQLLILVHVQTFDQHCLVLISHFIQLQIGHNIIIIVNVVTGIIDNALLEVDFIQCEPPSLVKDQSV